MGCKTLNAVDHLESELGLLDEVQHAEIVEILDVFAEEIREILKIKGRLLYEAIPEQKTPCHTCAFSRAIDRWKGFAATWYGMLVALRDNKRFLCHDNQSEWLAGVLDTSKLELCGGFVAVIVMDPEACAVAVQKAQCAIESIAPRVSSDKLVKPLSS